MGKFESIHFRFPHSVYTLWFAIIFHLAFEGTAETMGSCMVYTLLPSHHSLWVTFMKKKYMKPHPWSIQAKPSDFVLWKILSLNFKQVLLNSKCKIKSGIINFWYDIWLGEILHIESRSGIPSITLCLKNMLL